MHKSLFKLSAICSALLAITACGDQKSSSGTDTSNQYEAYINESLAQDTKVNFTVQGANASVPLPTFILMNPVDGTLEVPTGGDDALSNPAAALSQMDGWSTSEPISIPFNGVGFSLNPTVLSSGVLILELTDGLTGEPELKAVLRQKTDFQVVTQGDSVNILFAQPLNEKSNYILALTDEITDKDGDPVGMSNSYAALKTDTQTFETGDLSSLQQVIKGVEGIFTQAGTDPTTIVYSTWFTTQSVGDTLYATKAAIAQGLASKQTGGNGLSDIWKGSANPNDVDLSNAYTMAITSTADFADAVVSDENFLKYIDPTGTTQNALAIQEAAPAVSVSKGTVNLPYFLETGDNWNTQPFESAMPSLAIISNALSGDNASNITQQLVENDIDPTKLTDPTEQLKLIGLDLKNEDGSALDSERIITQYSPVPKIKSLEEVPFLLFTPKDASVGSTPIVIYQHGVTSAKENAYAFAANMVASGISVIAIDHPLHGERSLDDERSANTDPTAYINLSYLPVARDNVRESILDILGLRAALSVTAATLQANPNAEFGKINFAQAPRFFGHSLGGIVGVSAVAAANETLNNTEADDLFAFSSGAFANAGSQIAPLLIDSETFGPAIIESVGAENISSFTYAAQTVLDTVDPINAAYNIDAKLPVYVSEVDGDKVVPNDVPNTFAGTEPLASALGLTATNATNTAFNGTRNWIQFNNVASHSTAVAPSADFSDITHHTEMQTELIDFLGDNKLESVNSSVLK